MKTIIEILAARGINPADPKAPHIALSIDNEPFMRLAIERIGYGPHGKPAYSVAHYGEMNGDPMRDPDICFEVNEAGEWSPYSYRNDYAGVFDEIYETDEQGVAKNIRPSVLRGLITLAEMWDHNLREQGYTEAAANAREVQG